MLAETEYEVISLKPSPEHLREIAHQRIHILCEQRIGDL
jgi:hypothetical protein